MSSQKAQSWVRLLAIGSTALLIQFGGVAGARPHAEIQEQMRGMLSGAAAASHAMAGAQSHRDEASGLRIDAHSFTQRLLQGSSVSARGTGSPAQQVPSVAARSGKRPDTQTVVRQQLLGA